MALLEPPAQVRRGRLPEPHAFVAPHRTSAAREVSRTIRGQAARSVPGGAIPGSGSLSLPGRGMFRWWGVAKISRVDHPTGERTVTASVRSATPNLAKVFLRWILTGSSVRPMARAASCCSIPWPPAVALQARSVSRCARNSASRRKLPLCGRWVERKLLPADRRFVHEPALSHGDDRDAAAIGEIPATRSVSATATPGRQLSWPR